MTKEERTSKIAALVAERGYCFKNSLKGRMKAIDAELKSLGYQAEKPAARAAKRPAQPKASTR